MASDPLVVADIRRLGDRGHHVNVACPEPSPCLSGNLSGPSAVVNAAIERLEAVHQSAHALRGEGT